MTLPRGLYDQLITDALARQLEGFDESELSKDNLTATELGPHLQDLVARSLARVLDDLDTGDDSVKAQQLALVNEVLVDLRKRLSHDKERVDSLPAAARRLRAVHAQGAEAPLLPDTGLAEPWLFTAAKRSPSLYHEIRREAAACDQIDILVSFITVSGVRKLMDVLKAITAPDATGKSRTRIRVLTTTYTGATEFNALKQLAELNGCTVKVSLDGRRTRLHAKAWIFHRRTGFGAAYVGSANLSGAALLGGLEWTVKFTERNQESLFTTAKAHFDTTWADDEFETFDHTNAESCDALRAALKRESGGDRVDIRAYFDVTPKKHQQDILEQLAVEREHGRHRNLLVAATGTGKTVMAALDYRRTVALHHGSRPKLLFVAHRQEILKQAMSTYRGVLRDHSFGALLGGGHEPDQHDFLFATIQSVASRNLIERLGADYWYTVVIDECHRVAAQQFDTFARAIRPAILLGLTATPERTDGQLLTPYFDARPDGSPAAELRLWHALDLQLLSPFEYFGCNDDTDFSDVPWNRPGEIEAVDKLVTGNEVRARMIVNEWNRLSGNALSTRAVVFCVSVAHAEFMTRQFAMAGIKAVCLTGQSPEDERKKGARGTEAWRDHGDCHRGPVQRRR